MYYTFVTIALFFVPIIVMATAYACVVWRLWANVLPGEHTAANINHQHQAKKKVCSVCPFAVSGSVGGFQETDCMSGMKRRLHDDDDLTPRSCVPPDCSRVALHVKGELMIAGRY